MIYIGGIFNQFLPLSLNALTEGENLEFRVVTSQASTLVVNWGDGTSDVYETTFSGGLHSVEISHTYSVAYTGNMEISCTSGNEKIIRFDTFVTTTSIIAFTTTQIGNFIGLEEFDCRDADNVISGDIADLPNGLIKFYCFGSNITDGSVANLPPNLEYYNNQGANTTIGNIGGLPTSLTTYINQGLNTTSGDIGTLQEGLLNYTNLGNNTTSGDIADLPSTLTKYWNQGANTTTGDVASLQNSLEFYSNFGNNTTFGDVGQTPAGMRYFVNRGLSQASYTTKVWNSTMRTVYVDPTVAGQLSTAEVDQLLIDLSAVSSWVIISPPEQKEINLANNNQVRSSASDTAVTTLTGNGVTVTTN